MNQDQEIWTKNFSILKAGYHLMSAVGNGFQRPQEILFDGKTYMSKYILVFKGLDLEGAYFEKKQLRDLIEATVRLIQDQPDKINNAHQKDYQLSDEYFELGKKILEKGLMALSNKELGQIYIRLIKAQEEVLVHGVITTWFVDSDGENLSKLLINKTKVFIEKSASKVESAAAFSLLTTYPKDTLAA